MAPPATPTVDRIASLSAEKWSQPYQTLMCWLRCHYDFTLIRSSSMSMRESRQQHPGLPRPDLVLAEGHVPKKLEDFKNTFMQVYTQIFLMEFHVFSMVYHLIHLTTNPYRTMILGEHSHRNVVSHSPAPVNKYVQDVSPTLWLASSVERTDSTDRRNRSIIFILFLAGLICIAGVTWHYYYYMTQHRWKTQVL